MSNLNKLAGKWKGDIPKKNISSSVQLRCYDLYFKELDDFSIDDIRFMLIQELGIDFLIDRALSQLEKDILIEASYYEGDLLSSVLKLEADYWSRNIERYKKLKKLIEKNQVELASKLDLSMDADREINKGISKFNQLY